MSDAKVEFAGNADALLAAHKKIEEAKNKEIAGLKALLAESKKTYSEEQKLLREKQAALDKTRTAQEVYNDQIAKWTHMMVQGKMTLEQFNRLKASEKKALDDSTAATKRQTDAQEQSAFAASKAGLAQKTLATNTTGTMGAMAGMAASFVSATAIIGTATAALRAFAEEEKRIQKESIGVVLTIDELQRNYAVAAGLKTDEQMGESTARIMKAAKANAVTPQTAFDTAEQLGSVGFKDSEGVTLDTALKIIKSSDAKKGSPKDYIEGAARYMEASNQELNAENLLGIASMMRGAFETPVVASDLPEFAEAGPALAQQGVDLPTGLAMMTELKRGYSAPMVGTKMRNITQRLSKIRDDKQSMEAMEVLGLSPDDIDAIGESMPVALKRIGDAVAARPKTERAGLMGKLFASENQGPAQFLIDRLAGVEANKELFKDKSVYEAGVKFQMEGESAVKQRATVDLIEQQLKNREGVSDVELMDRYQEREYTRKLKATEGQPGGRLARFSLWMEKKQSDWRESIMGADTAPVPGDLTGSSIRSTMRACSEDKERFESYRRDVRGGGNDPQMAENNATLKQIAAEQKRAADALANPARPAPTAPPAVANPNLTGRTDR